MNRAFVDLDGVVVDFDGYMRTRGTDAQKVKDTPGAYAAMLPCAGAIEAVHSLIGMRFEVWIATKPPTGRPWAYKEKAEWVMQYLPELKRRIVITHDKGFLGDAGDILIDDRVWRANCHQFQGALIAHRSWDRTLVRCRAIAAGDHRAAAIRRDYMRQRATYRELIGTLYPPIAYEQLMSLRADYVAAGGLIDELLGVPQPEPDGRAPFFT